MSDGEDSAVDEAFGHWLAGFLDGEGCFYVGAAGRGNRYRCRLEVRLRGDDEGILRAVCERTGLGDVRRVHLASDHHPSVLWAVGRKEELAAIVGLLDRFPLRAKKARDYAIWREAVQEWCSDAPDWLRMGEAMARLREGRLYGHREPVLEIVVQGHPEPAGSKRAFLHPHTKRIVVTDANKKSKPWQREVAAKAAEMWESPPLESALEVEFLFFLARPEAHWRTGRYRHLLRDAAPAAPIGRPDVLKLARGVEDALTGVVWGDDAQIVREMLEKRYGEPERVEVRVWMAALQTALDLPPEERERCVEPVAVEALEDQLSLA